MKLRPLHDRVVVKRLEQETKTASGIVIPDAAAEKPDQGEVLAVGPGKRNDKGDFVALNVKVGDRVLFGKYSGPDRQGRRRRAARDARGRPVRRSSRSKPPARFSNAQSNH
jgi:chaperonin GroES